MAGFDAAPDLANRDAWNERHCKCLIEKGGDNEAARDRHFGDVEASGVDGEQRTTAASDLCALMITG